MMRFMDRVALVTGGGSGIGAAAGRRLAQEGAHVILADRDAEAAEGVAKGLRQEGMSAEAVACDQTVEADVRALFDGAVARAGRLDVCFANAGFGRYGNVLEISADDLRRHLDVNVTGTFLICQAAARRMVADASGGAIVINASCAALYPTPLFTAYGVAKAAAGMLAKCMAQELGVHRIRVNAVLPGVIATSMTQGILESQPAVRDLLEFETPMGRIGAGEDVAAAVAYLASDDATYVTGEALLIDGGHTLNGYPRWFATDNSAAHAPDWRPFTPGLPGR